MRGLPLRLVDTAGFRAATDAVEQEGIHRTEKQIAGADLILEIVDGSLPASQRIEIPQDSRAKHILVVNKADLGLHEHWRESKGVVLSCMDNTGLDALADRVFGLVAGGLGDGSASIVAINARHRDCLVRAHGFLSAAIDALERNESPEFVALELRSSLDAIGEVVGKVDPEELLGVIFGSFCIGK